MSRPLPRMTDAELSSVSGADEPGLGALTTSRGNLPLRAVEVAGRIDGLLGQVCIRQTFVNPFDEPLEATYIFPLPDRAAVRGFRMEVAGRIIEGVLEEREKARRDYDRAIARGHRAAIAEEERPDVFTLRVGNLMPGESATVQLDLAGMLPYARGEVTFRFPLVVAPRYIPGTPLPGTSVGDGTAVDTDATPDASRISPPVLLPGFPNPVRLSLTIDLHDHADLIRPDHLRSSLHAILCEENGDFLRIRLEPGDRLDRDFILRFRLGGDDPADPIVSTLTLHPDPTGDAPGGTFALTMIPPAGLEQARRPRDVAFVLDRSGSMQGWKIVAARRAVGRMIDTLNEADRFGLIAFDDDIETPPRLPAGLVAAGDRQRFRALEYLAHVDARGGTEMAQPLQQAAQLLSSSDRQAILVLITDGQVGNEDQILRTLAPGLEHIRVFTLGIDQAVNAGFLRRLADLGHGACELVESEDRLDEVMTAIHRQIGTPLLTNLEIEAAGFEVEPDSLVPERLPDLFAGTPLVLLGRFNGPPAGTLHVRAIDASHQTWSRPLDGSRRDNPAIAAAWARGQVRKLEDRYVVSPGAASELERQIVAVSLRHHVLSRFTAFVAIDHAEVANPSGHQHRVTQPVEQPSGWGMAAMQAPAAAPRISGRCMPATPIEDFDFSGPFEARACSPPSEMPPTPPASAPRESFQTRLRAYRRPRAMRFAPQSGAYGPGSIADALSHPALGPVPSPRPKDYRTLAQVAAGRPMEPAEAVSLVAELAEAIQLLLHRRFLLKALAPDQIVIDPKGQVMLARLKDDLVPADGQERHAAVDEAFMPPEHLATAPAPLEIRATVYALGAILYQLITGVPPFAGPPASIVATKLRGEMPTFPPGNAAVSTDLRAIILRAMAPRPDDRHATAGELAEALRGLSGVKPSRRPNFWKQPGKY